MALVYPANNEYHQQRPMPHLSHKASYLYMTLGHRCWNIIENELKGNNCNKSLCFKS